MLTDQGRSQATLAYDELELDSSTRAGFCKAVTSPSVFAVHFGRPSDVSND